MLSCKHCPVKTMSSPDAARMIGWRMWSGTTVGGQRKADVVCPSCAGTDTAAPPAPAWQVRCSTCDWEYEDEYNEGPLDEAAAKRMASDHECEPEVELLPPGADKWVAA